MRKEQVSKMRMSGWLLLGIILLFGTAAAQNEGGQTPPLTDYSPVTDARLLNPEPENWLMYKRTYGMGAYSPLDQITVDNAAQLVPVWAYSTGETNGHESPPLVNNGIMFATGAFSTLFALDAKTGDVIWQYKRQLPADVFPEVCCDVVNRGVALYGDKVYFNTLDSHLLAFDAATGKIVWDVTVDDYLTGATMTMVPLIVGGKVMVGISGGEYGVRGFLAAYDSEDGSALWKTYMTAGPGEIGNETWTGDTWKTGGGALWLGGSYDPDTNLSYWGTGNAGPWMADLRPGDNLYTSSVVAIDVDSGEIKSHYQYNPNESWDYDEVSDHVIADITYDGKPLQAVLHAGRNGMFYVLDRANDLSFVYAVPYSKAAITISGFEEGGRPIVDPDHKPGSDKTVVTCPVAQGANNWEGIAFDPNSNLAFIPTTEFCMQIGGTGVPAYVAGQHYMGANVTGMIPENMDTTGALQALDVTTGEIVWRIDQQLGVRSPAMVTKGGVLFIGDVGTREFRAHNAATGEELWKFTTNAGIIGVPTTYEVDGVQYVAVESGPGGDAMIAVRQAAALLNVPYIEAEGGVIWVFALHPSATK